MDLETGARGDLADQAAVGVLTRTFPVELVDRVIDQYWRREQRTRTLPARLVFYFVLALCLFPHESYRSTMKILMSAFGRGTQDYQVPTSGSIADARRRLGSGPLETAVRAVLQPRARPDTRGAWYQDWLLTAVDGTTFTVPDTPENDQEFGRPGSGRAAHGGSAFKVYDQTSKGLQWIADVDQYGDYIVGKWKGGAGYFIPNSSLRGVG